MSLIPNIVGSGGYLQPTTGTSGFMQTAIQMPFYNGPSIIQHIPEFQRDFNLRDALILKIREGRDNLMRMILDSANRNGAYVTTDVQPRWLIEYQQIPRMYLKVQANQGGTTGQTYKTGTFVLDNPKDAKRIQVGDELALMCTSVDTARNTASALLDYYVTASGGAIYAPKNDYSKPLPELCKVTSVNYDTGAVSVIRNVGGDSQTAADTVTVGTAFTVKTTATTDPGANTVNQADAFFIRMGNAMAEGRDDQKVFSFANTWDYNYCQYVMRKWGWTDIQKNIYARGGEQAPAKNRRQALELFYDELEWHAIFGIRKEEFDEDNRWIGHAGGILEYIPADHYIPMVSPTYTSTSYMGDFTIQKFNKKLEGCFYYGSNEKMMLCGQNFFTAFATMLNVMTQNIPMIVSEWKVVGYKFTTSSGGVVTVVPSDKLSLNGMSNYAIMIDQAHFEYGHLNNMDINIAENLPNGNIHEESGEIFGVITYKRSNPNAHWVFVLIPNSTSV